MGVALVEFLDQAVAHKPLDASDCTTLEFAKRELSRLRRVTAKVVKVLRDADNAVKQHAEHQNGFMKENNVLNGQAKANKADLLEKYRPKSTRSRSAPASNTDRDQKNPQEDEAGRRDSKASSSTPMTGCSQSTEKRNHVKGRSKSRTKSRSKSKARNKKKKSNKKRKNLSVDLSYQKYIKQTYDKSPEDRDLIKSALKNNQLFENFRDAQLEEFVDVFSPESFEEGSTVVRQATHGNTFYIVKSGTLKIYVDTIIDGRKMETQVGEPYGSGSAFGELALLYDSPRVATIRASEACVFWVIDRTAFKGLQLQLKQADHNIKLAHLKRVKVGNQMFADVLDDDQLERMALATQFENFKDGKAIFKEGEIGSNFYMIVTGQVDVYKDGGDYPINHLGPDTYFGERALLQSDGGCRTATCVAKTDVECLTLCREDFTDLLGSLDEIMVGRRQSLSLRQSSGDLIAPKAADLLSDDLGGDQGFTSYTLDGLKIKGVLGEGAFGRVHLAKGRQDGRLYALKAQGKHHIATNGSQTKVISEFGIMTDLNHPLIVRCYQAFQDTRYIYFLMSLLPGGDVLDLLEDKIKFSEDWARFYGATVVLTFEYIHSRKIAFRDLKPENLVLDADGYAHLVDFGLAKQIAGKTWTVCGTPDYVAPEIVKAEGHDWGCDYWALGVLLYELVSGDPPFTNDNPSVIARNILKGKYETPRHFSPDLTALISGLLTKQSKRLGRIKGGIRSIRKHAWFGDFDFRALLRKEMEVPYEPKLGTLSDLGGKIDNSCWEDAPESDWEPLLNPNYRQMTSAQGVARKLKQSLPTRPSKGMANLLGRSVVIVEEKNEDDGSY